MNIKDYEPFFGSWYIKGDKPLGEGSFGKVYKIEREEFNKIYESALKIISITPNEAEIKSIISEGLSGKDTVEQLNQFVESIIKEYSIMSELKGNTNIVNYEDHMVIKHKEDIGCDILIKMELLTSLTDYISDKTNQIRIKDVIKLGIDICKALELCQKCNVVHRDIKPENIFISKNGDFKLGDFGIARQIEKTSYGLSKKGTYTYMAPEIYRGDAYGTSVDIYSLGIVMYRMLKNNRTPFLPKYPNPITHDDREKALFDRMSGKKIPPPINATNRLKEIILKACSFKPEHRYSSPIQMKQELEAINYTSKESKIIYPFETDIIEIKSAPPSTDGVETTEITETVVSSASILPSIESKNFRFRNMLIVVVALFLVSLTSYFLAIKDKYKKTNSTTIQPITQLDSADDIKSPTQASTQSSTQPPTQASTQPSTQPPEPTADIFSPPEIYIDFN